MLSFKHLTLFLTLLASVLASGQINKHKNDSLAKSTVNLKTDEFELKNYKASPSDRIILEFNHTGWLNIPSNIQMSWKSVGFNIALMFDKPIGNSNFSIGYGIGLFSHNFHSNGNFIQRFDSLKQHNVTDIIPKSGNYRINRFGTKILEAPFELRFKTKTIHKFKIMIGGKAGYIVHDFKKIFDDKGKYKVFEEPNLNRLQYGFVFRIGVEQFCFTACYYISEVFQRNKGVTGITPYSFGIAVIPY